MFIRTTAMLARLFVWFKTAEGVVRDTGHMYSYIFDMMTKVAEP